MDTYRKISVLEELEKNPDLRKEDIEEILEWIETVPHLPKITGLRALFKLNRRKKIINPRVSLNFCVFCHPFIFRK